MSNPAVVDLSSTNTSIGYFRIEDNYGESIHIHLNGFRADITNQQLEKLSDEVRIILNSFIQADGFDVNLFSEGFLAQIYYMLPKLEKLEIVKRRISGLQFEGKSKIGTSRCTGVDRARIYKALMNDNSENNKKIQDNYFFQSNDDRIFEMLESLKIYGYPYDNKYIVIFNDQNIIRDGQHRAACLYYLNGDIEIPVLRCQFKDNAFNITRNGQLFAIKSSIKASIVLLKKWLIKKKHFIERNLHRFESFGKE